MYNCHRRHRGECINPALFSWNYYFIILSSILMFFAIERMMRNLAIIKRDAPALILPRCQAMFTNVFQSFCAAISSKRVSERFTREELDSLTRTLSAGFGRIVAG